jgi:diguanylate cyclase (GGDEF)-like protein
MIKMSELADLVEIDQRIALLVEAKQLATEIMAQGKLSTIEYRLHEISVLKEDYKSALSHFKAYHEHSSKSDAKKLLAKIEIMSIEQDHSNEFNGEIDLSDFTNMGIFGDSNIELTIESINKDLHYKALTDELTGLANRRKINNMINQIAYSSIKSNYGFLMIDIDHFKWVNDNEGHLYGDQCLIRVANILNEWMGTYKQFVGRYGGEEFLCIVNLVNAFELKLMAETIRTNIESEQIGYHVDNSERTLTVSIGCALWCNEQEDDTYTVLEHADRALYMAKMEGRNRVVIYNN